jgi:hypothetical protein
VDGALSAAGCGGFADDNAGRGKARQEGAEMPRRPPAEAGGLLEKMSGDVLLSHNPPVAVPSALRGLTSGFGMGPGISLSLRPP